MLQSQRMLQQNDFSTLFTTHQPSFQQRAVHRLATSSQRLFVALAVAPGS
jgi:hypothetical protein